jgi:signal transduction histidine kinase
LLILLLWLASGSAKPIARKARETAEGSNEAKDQIIAKTSHKLHTPLHGIINLAGSTRIGAYGSVSPQATYDLKITIGGAHRLVPLVNGILRFSKL